MGLPRTAQRAFIAARKERKELGGELVIIPQLQLLKPYRKRQSITALDTECWLLAMELSEMHNITPWDALLLAVRRRASRVQLVDQNISNIIQQHQENGNNPDVLPDDIRPWLKESRLEEQVMVRSAKLAIDAGIAEAMIRRLNMEGKVTTDALIAALDSLELTPDQRITAINTLHEQLTKDVLGSGNIIEQ